MAPYFCCFAITSLKYAERYTRCIKLLHGNRRVSSCVVLCLRTVWNLRPSVTSFGAMLVGDVKWAQMGLSESVV